MEEYISVCTASHLCSHFPLNKLFVNAEELTLGLGYHTYFCSSHKMYYGRLCCWIIISCLSKDQVVSAVLENYQDTDKETNFSNNSIQGNQKNCDPEEYKVENQTPLSSDVMKRDISWRRIVNEKDYYTTYFLFPEL